MESEAVNTVGPLSSHQRTSRSVVLRFNAFAESTRAGKKYLLVLYSFWMGKLTEEAAFLHFLNMTCSKIPIHERKKY
jgi:hypothetical protein